MRRHALVAIALLCACRKGPETTGVSATVSADAAPHAVVVDPSQITSGRVRTEVVAVRAPSPTTWVAGELVAGEHGEADVTALASGRVATLDVAVGDTVKRGQLMATIESPEAGRATAELLRAEARVKLAERAMKRQLDLEAQQATSKAAVDEARAEDSAARADLLAARTLLSSLGGAQPHEGADAGLGAARLPLRAPIDGVVTKRSVALGAPVAPDKAVFHIVAPRARVVIARLPETLDAPLTKGTRVKARPRGETETCDATLTSNLGVVDDNRTIPVRVTLDETCPLMPAGRYVEIAIPTGTSADAGATLLLVSASALTDVRGVPTVFVASGPEGSFQARGVRVGPTLGGDVVVESGVSAGERVAVEGVVLLKGEFLKSELQ